MRTYLDHNATTPLRAEARAAMIAAMDVAGNPSSVHAEGRAALGVIERARAQVAALLGCKTSQIIFTSSATEAAALAVAQKNRHGGIFAALPTEHDCLRIWGETPLASLYDNKGQQSAEGASAFLSLVTDLARESSQADRGPVALIALSTAKQGYWRTPAKWSAVALRMTCGQVPSHTQQSATSPSWQARCL